MAFGQLEQSVMDALWDAPDALTANELRDVLAQDSTTPAVTTVLTVLGRLVKKGFVSKDSSVRPNLFTVTQSREDHTVNLLNDVLGTASDKQAVLARFIGGIDPQHVESLKRILN